MAYLIKPQERDHDTHPIDVPLHRFGGEKPTHHRVRMPNGGGVIPPDGLVVTDLDPHYVRQQQNGEVEIVEGTVVDDAFVAKPAPAAEVKE